MRLLRHLFAVFAALALSSLANAQHSSVSADPEDERGELPNEIVSPRHPLAVGQVMGVDRAAGTITILHKPIPDVSMTETMTMIFRVAEMSMLEGITVGDKVRFEVKRDGRSYVVVRMEHSN